MLLNQHSRLFLLLFSFVRLRIISVNFDHGWVPLGSRWLIHQDTLGTEKDPLMHKQDIVLILRCKKYSDFKIIFNYLWFDMQLNIIGIRGSF